MSKSAWVMDVAEAEFEEKVIKKSHEVPVVVDFWAPWCGPCRSLGPILERLVDDRKGTVLLAKVNTDDAQELAMQFGVNGIPHVVAIRKGRAVLQFTGLLPENQIVSFLDRLAPSEAEKTIESAAQMEKANPAEAERLYRDAIAKDPRAQEALIGLARLLVAKKMTDEASGLLERISVQGDYHAEADKLRAVVWLQEQAKELPSEETLRARVKAKADDAQSLLELGCVLAANNKTAESLETLVQAGAADRKLASSNVKETMVKIFFVIGVRSELADAYRDKLRALLY